MVRTGLHRPPLGPAHRLRREAQPPSSPPGAASAARPHRGGRHGAAGAPPRRIRQRAGRRGRASVVHVDPPNARPPGGGCRHAELARRSAVKRGGRQRQADRPTARGDDLRGGGPRGRELPLFVRQHSGRGVQPRYPMRRRNAPRVALRGDGGAGASVCGGVHGERPGAQAVRPRGGRSDVHYHRPRPVRQSMHRGRGGVRRNGGEQPGGGGASEIRRGR